MKRDGLRLWALAALNREIDLIDVNGLSYEQCSRRALAICEAAVETGRTFAAGPWIMALANAARLSENIDKLSA